MHAELLRAIEEHQAAFGANVPQTAAENLSAYYELLLARNGLLHLVAPCDAEEFAVRHILESLFISDRLPAGSILADVGSGGGLPGIPLAVFRNDLKVILIESKAKKAGFLREASIVSHCSERVRIVNKQFEEAGIPGRSVVTVRALDKFTTKLPRLLKWSHGRRLVLFGGPSMETALKGQGQDFGKTLIPESEQRFVFELKR